MLNTLLTVTFEANEECMNTQASVLAHIFVRVHLRIGE